MPKTLFTCPSKTDNLAFCEGKQVKTTNYIIAPAGFWPLGQNLRRHYRNPRVIENMYGITRKNLESQEPKGSVGNIHDWMKDRKGSVGNVYDWRSLIKGLK